MPHADPASLRGQKSTNVRALGIARLVLAPLSRVAPGATARLAERLFFTPPRRRRASGEQRLSSAAPMELIADGRRVRGWRWGSEGRPVVVLVHGWGGQAAQLTSFVPALLERGFSVVAFDAPGHGRSGRGRSSAPEFARALRAVARRVGEVHGIVAHSLGGAAVALALRDGLAAERVVFVAPAANPPAWVDVFAARLGLTPQVVAAMRGLSERRIGLSWSELDVPALARRQRAALLVLHDRDDREVPKQDGESIAAAWPDARFEATRGLGHNRILRDAGAVERAVAHLTRGVEPGPACACEDGAALPCQVCLERTLFDREGRIGPARPAAA